jgi:signal transduction histidine kinase
VTDHQVAASRGLDRVERMLVGWLSKPARAGARHEVVIVAAVLSVALIGVVDAILPDDVSLAAVYLLPAVATTVLLSAAAGMAVSAESALVWVIADAVVPSPPPLLVSVENGVLRFVILAVVVVLLDALRNALSDARASDRRSREFLGYAAHQLRTPVSGLRLSAEALIIAGAPADQERLLSNVAAECDRIGRLVASLLQIARIDQGEALTRELTDLVKLVSDEVEFARDRSPALDIQFRDVGAVALLVRVSPEATREALTNLLDNARRHARARVEVVVHSVPDGAEILVTDDGAGLPTGAEERAFERFVSLDGRGGAGLGLAIARSLTEAQGGQLVYERGRFAIRLPAQRLN